MGQPNHPSTRGRLSLRFGHQELEWRASLLRVLLIGNLVALLGVWMLAPNLDLLIGPWRWLILGGNTALLVVNLALVHFGLVRPAAVLYCVVQWTILATLHVRFGLDSGVVAVGMINMALTAGLTFSALGGAIIAGISVIWISAVLLLVQRGWYVLPGPESLMLDHVAAYGATLAISLFLVGYGLRRVNFNFEAAVEANERLETRVAQADALADLGEFVVRSASVQALHQGVVERLARALPGYRVAIFVSRKHSMARVAETADFEWPSQLSTAVLERVASQYDDDDDIPSSVIRLSTTDEEDGLPAGLTDMIPIRPGRRLVGVLVTVKHARSEGRAPKEFLRTVASLVGAAHDRLAKDAELRQAQKVEAVGQLAGGIAHDFNNLLTSILGSASLARRHSTDPQRVDRLLGDIEHASDHAAILTRQLLTFARKQGTHPEDISVHEVVEELEHMLRRLLPETIELSVELSPQRGIVHADRHAIEQVIWNLVLNARDAIGTRGTISIRVTTDPHRGPRGSVMLEIGDDGCGIAKSDLERIFEPFFTTKSMGQGTGLGLATVRRIAEDLGAQLRVKSSPNRGSSFSLDIPLVSGASRPLPARVEPSRAPVSFAGRGRNRTALLVEDHELVRGSMEALLENAGYRVVAVPDGQAALEELSRLDQVTVVVSDVVMPRVTGDELVKAMRARGDQTPVVLLTGYADDRLDQLDTIALKGVPLLDKPVGTRKLLDTIDAVIAASEPAPSPSTLRRPRVSGPHRG